MHRLRFHNFRVGPTVGSIIRIPKEKSLPFHDTWSRCTTTVCASNINKFTTIDETNSVTIEVKKSKFIATAWHITSPDEGLQLIRSFSDLSASHNCWAIKISDYRRSNDDGEPAGTAGRPILSAIEAEDLDYTACLITRIFGGIKLGTGGLVRAYSSAARECLQTATKKTVSPAVVLHFAVPLDLMGRVFQIIELYSAKKLHEKYESDMVTYDIEIPASSVDMVKAALLNATSGKALFITS